MAFGEEPNANQLLNLTKRIKTFTEEVNPESSEILEIRNNISLATDLIFLGFAFHKLNMNLIFPENEITSSQYVNCFATTYGLSKSDEKFIKLQLSNNLSNHVIDTLNADCNNFFNEYRQSLSF
ncbi:MAG: hypothetical protein V4629_09335 [Pseudomonadota bacterium]